MHQALLHHRRKVMTPTSAGALSRWQANLQRGCVYIYRVIQYSTGILVVSTGDCSEMKLTLQGTLQEAPRNGPTAANFVALIACVQLLQDVRRQKHEGRLVRHRE